MRTPTRTIMTCCSAMLIVTGTRPCATAGPLQVGFGIEDITPAAGADIPGGFGKMISKGTRDPLFAVATVISDGEKAVALVGVDAVFVPNKVVQPARELIEKFTQISGARVLIGASHTHSGGPVATCFGSDADPDCIERAWQTRQSAEIGNEFGPGYCEMFGMKLAGEVIRTIHHLTWLNNVPRATATETVPIAIRLEPDAVAENPAFALGSGPDEVFARECKFVAEERERTPQLMCEVQAIHVGLLGIATNGAELFCDLGLQIKKASPFKPTWVASLSNEYVGYVPTDEAFKRGGYEQRTARSSTMAPEAGEKLVAAAAKALARVAPVEN